MVEYLSELGGTKFMLKNATIKVRVNELNYDTVTPKEIAEGSLHIELSMDCSSKMLSDLVNFINKRKK